MRANRKENAGKEIDVSGREKVMVEAQTPASNHFFSCVCVERISGSENEKVFHQTLNARIKGPGSLSLPSSMP